MFKVSHSELGRTTHSEMHYELKRDLLLEHYREIRLKALKVLNDLLKDEQSLLANIFHPEQTETQILLIKEIGRAMRIISNKRFLKKQGDQ